MQINQPKELPQAVVMNGQLVLSPQRQFLLTSTKGGVWIDRSAKNYPPAITVSFLREGVIQPAGFASCQHRLETFGLN